MRTGLKVIEPESTTIKQLIFGFLKKKLCVVVSSLKRTAFFLCTGTIEDIAVSENGELCCTVSDDKTAKVFDIINFGEKLKTIGKRLFD